MMATEARPRQRIKHHTRAAVACETCRRRKVRCVRYDTREGCRQCKSLGIKCAIQLKLPSPNTANSRTCGSSATPLTPLEELLIMWQDTSPYSAGGRQTDSCDNNPRRPLPSTKQLSRPAQAATWMEADTSRPKDTSFIPPENCEIPLDLFLGSKIHAIQLFTLDLFRNCINSYPNDFLLLVKGLAKFAYATDHDSITATSISNPYQPKKQLMHKTPQMSNKVLSIQALCILGDMELGLRCVQSSVNYLDRACRLSMKLLSSFDSMVESMDSKENIGSIVALILTSLIYVSACSFSARQGIYRQCLTEINSGLKSLMATTQSLKNFEVVRQVQLCDAWIQLIDIAGHFDDLDLVQVESEPSNILLKIYGLDKQMNEWYNNLPSCLKWTTAAIQKSPLEFFLLHQHYHFLLIRMHQTRGSRLTQSTQQESETLQHFRLKNSRNMAAIFKARQKRPELTGQVMIMDVQHLSKAIEVLRMKSKGLAHPGDDLSFLTQALQQIEQEYNTLHSITLGKETTN